MTIPALPSGTIFGKVVGRFIRAVADAPEDEDRLPDAKPALGTITFTPVTPNFTVSAPEPMTVVRTVIRCSTNDQGRLTDPAGAVGVWLVEGQYKVSYALDGGVIIASHTVTVTADHTEATPYDLTTHVPSGGPLLVPSQFEELSSRIDQLTQLISTPDHGELLGLEDDDHSQYLNNERGDLRYYTKAQVGELLPDGSHSSLSDLDNDDHPQYHTDERGDLRYYTKDEVDVLVSAASSAIPNRTVSIKTTNYTLKTSDNGNLILFDATTGVVLSVPTDASQAFPVGGSIDVMAVNTGMVTVAAVTPGTTSVNGTPTLVTRARYSAFSVIKIGANAWVVVGDLAS